MKYSALIAFLILLIASLACSTAPAPVPASDPNAVNTSIAQSIAVRQTEAALANPPTSTFTPEPPTLTPEPAFSPTLEATAAPDTPLITVSQDTNCRTGPGAIYERVGMLLVGEVAEVVGRDVTGEYWLIINPDEGPESCWVWGEYGTVTGNTYTLLFPTAMPVPDSAFTVALVGLQSCSNTWWVNFILTNASAAPFKSMFLNVRDVDTVTDLSVKADNFSGVDNCSGGTNVEMLVAGASVTVSSAPIAYNPTGNNFNARIKVCTEVNLGGTCVTKEFNFQP